MHFPKKIILLIFTAITFFAYFSSMTGPFMWDDEQFVTRNVYVQNFDLFKILTTNTIAGADGVSNYYRPVTSISFAIDSKIWGNGSFGFHLTNFLIHVGAGMLLFLLLLELGIGELVSFCIALIFLIHPVQTEAISYISSRGDSLYALFLFASFFFFVKALGQKKSAIYYIDAVGLYMLSILSKETAIAAFPLFFVFILLNKLRTKQSLRSYTSAFLAAFAAAVSVLVYATLRLTVLNFQDTLNYYVGHTYYSTHLFVRVLTFFRVLWVYLGILLWPYPLHMERSIGLLSSFLSWEVIGMTALVIGLGTLSIWEIKKKHTGFILFGLCLSGCLLIPVSGFVPINGILYEHWLYVPLAGLCIMVYGLWNLFIPRGVLRKKLIYFVVLLSIVYIVLTIRQNTIWADPITFYKYTLAFAPDSTRLHNNLGMTLAAAGRENEAIGEYKKALSLGGTYPQIYNNLGTAEMAVGDYDAAEKDLTTALTSMPGFIITRNNLIRLYLITKKFDKARSISNNNPQVEAIIRQLQQQ